MSSLMLTKSQAGRVRSSQRDAYDVLMSAPPEVTPRAIRKAAAARWAMVVDPRRSRTRAALTTRRLTS